MPRLGFRFFGLLLLGAVLVRCGISNKSVGENKNVPEWYLDTPEAPDYIYAAKSATLQKRQAAIDTATYSARVDLAKSLETKIESMMKQYREETEGEMLHHLIKTQKSITSQVLHGSMKKETEVYQEDDGPYRAFVLMEVPVGKVAATFLNEMREKDPEGYTRFRASQAFEEMQEVIDKYKEEKGRDASSENDQ